MNQLKFIHCADLHLDSPFEGIRAIEPDIAKALRNATFEAFSNIIDLAIDEKVDFIIIAGDVYNNVNRSLRAQLQFRDEITRAADSGILSYISHGNHDPLSGWDAGLSMPNGVHRFSGNQVEMKEYKRDGIVRAHIYGISYKDKGIRKNLASLFKKQGDDIFSIGVLHCNLGGDSKHDNYAPCTLVDLEKCGFDYWALGHIHSKKIVKEENPCIIYPGNTQGLSIKESGSRGCYIVELDTSGHLNNRYFSTDIIRWDSKEIDTTNIDTLDQLLETLDEVIENTRVSAEGRAAILSLQLLGRGDIHRELRKIEIDKDILLQLRESEITREDFVWVESINNNTSPTIDIEKRREAKDYVGDFLCVANNLRNDQEVLKKVHSLLERRSEYRIIAKQIDNLSESELLAIIDDAEIMGLDCLIQSEE